MFGCAWLAAPRALTESLFRFSSGASSIASMSISLSAMIDGSAGEHLLATGEVCVSRGGGGGLGYYGRRGEGRLKSGGKIKQWIPKSSNEKSEHVFDTW